MKNGIVKTRGKADLINGPILKGLLVFAIPVVLTDLIQQFYSMVDLMVAGKCIGSIGTVGVSVGGEISDLMTPVATAFASAGQIYIAQLFGAGKQKHIKEAISTLLLAADFHVLTQHVDFFHSTPQGRESIEMLNQYHLEEDNGIHTGSAIVCTVKIFYKVINMGKINSTVNFS